MHTYVSHRIQRSIYYSHCCFRLPLGIHRYFCRFEKPRQSVEVCSLSQLGATCFLFRTLPWCADWWASSHIYHTTTMHWLLCSITRCSLSILLSSSCHFHLSIVAFFFLFVLSRSRWHVVAAQRAERACRVCGIWIAVMWRLRPTLAPLPLFLREVLRLLWIGCKINT